MVVGKNTIVFFAVDAGRSQSSKQREDQSSFGLGFFFNFKTANKTNGIVYAEMMLNWWIPFFLEL